MTQPSFARRSTGALSVIASLLVGCGGGGSAGRGVAPVTMPATAAPSAGPLATATIAVTVPTASAPPIAVRGASRSARRPRYVSPGTSSVAIFLNGAATPAATVPLGVGTVGPNGTTYSLALPVPVGSDAFGVSLLSSGGLVLATGTSTVTIGYGLPNTVAVTALGVPAVARIVPATLVPPAATATFPLGVTVYDAAGYAISGTYAYPLTLNVAGTTSTLASSADAAAATAALTAATTPVRVSIANAAGRYLGAATLRPGAVATGDTAIVATGGTDDKIYHVDTRTFAVSLFATFGGIAPTVVRTTPDGRTILVGLANGLIDMYSAQNYNAMGILEPHGDAPMQSVVDVAIDDLSQTAYALIAVGGTSYVVDESAIPDGSGERATLAGAVGCTSVAIDATSGLPTASCANGLYSFAFATNPGIAVLASSVPGGGLAEQFLSPFALLSSSGTGSVSVYQATSTTAPAAYTVARTLTVPSGSTALALDPTGSIAYVGTASGVTVLDDTAAPTSVLGTIATSAAPLALTDIPGGYVLPDAQVWALETGGAIQPLDTGTLTALTTITLPGPVVGLAFAP
jgi:hypothetical protein